MEEQSRTYILEASDLSVSFETDAGEVQAVRDVSLSLKEGEVLAIVGESGCGKSSLGRLLVRLEKCTSGKIYLDGQDMENLYRKDRLAFRRRTRSGCTGARRRLSSAAAPKRAAA